MNVSAIFNGNVLVVVVDGKRHSINSTHPNWQKALEFYRQKNYKKLIEAMDLPGAILKHSYGKVKVHSGAIYYDGQEIHGTLVKRILQFVQGGFPYEPYVRFLANLYKNPSEDARNELYDFLENGEMPITDDGCFLAYKMLREDMTSYNKSPDGTHLKHAIGKIVKMDPNEVDPSRIRLCSNGLHFCSYSYLPYYGGIINNKTKVVVVKVNPMDVVAIPQDLNKSKGRAWRYLPVSVVGKWENGNILTERLYSGKVTGNRLKAFNPKRDSFGRFASEKNKLGKVKVTYYNKRDENGRFVSAA